MKFIDSNLSIRISGVLMSVFWMLPLAFGYLTINKGFNPILTCLSSGLSGVLMGYFASRRAWNDYLERKRRRERVIYDLEFSQQNVNECQQIHFSLPEVEPIKNIEGETFDRLQKAIAAFPTRYPDYQSQPPKLNDDVRLWLHQAGLVTDGQKGREAHVFGKIIAEHFKLLGDTHKTQ